MRFSITTAVLVLATSVAARNCKKGLNYCGWNLIKIGLYSLMPAKYFWVPNDTYFIRNCFPNVRFEGEYKETIVAELNRVGITPDPNHIYNDLYHCKDDGGWISYSKQCHGDKSCQDGGAGNSDYC
jgi:hypothetical protein